MSNRHHLPAGQNIHGGPGGMPNVDNMHGGPAGGPRRRQQQQYMPQYHHQQQQHMSPPVYPNYNPYAPPQYYGMPPQYQNGGAMPSPGYMPYPGYARSPPTMHQYVPMVGVSVPPNYPRPSPHSPSLSTPYQPPQVPAPLPPQTPSSTHSSQLPPPPTPPTPQSREPVYNAPPPVPVTVAPPPAPSQPFRAPLPWLSHPDIDFPARSRKLRPRRKLLTEDSQPVSLPDQHGATIGEASATNEPAPSQTADAVLAELEAALSPDPSKDSGADIAPQSDVATADGANYTTDKESAEPVLQAPRPPPTSWANLFAKTPVAQVVGTNGTASETASNGAAPSETTAASNEVVGAQFIKPKTNSLAEAIHAYHVKHPEQIPFLEPRGLINTGNMCYMNSVLQVLMFCVPFYDFLDQVGKRAAHSFKSDTPLLDAMIMFMHEYNIVRSGATDEQLRKSIRPEEIERHGEPFTPEFVYEAIRQLSRFASMRRGHQQDAEEFLGFLLQSLDDECTHVMSTVAAANASETSSHDGSADPTGDWLEVGRKQRAAVTRSSGSNTSTPITKIFGGLLRSEFRVPGLKDSITTEPYQPLQLDIGASDIRNVVDALRGLTRPERIQGDFNSPRGKDVTATKQLYIETLPPVLILHLKRFQFDAEGGTTKIWKKIGYPLELEIPREVLSRQSRQTSNDGPPKYKLISVVYHHGKNASGGHYTVDVRRQDGREWLRLDDTVLRRVRSEDVAEMGSEEEVKEHRKEQGTGSAAANRFGAMVDEDSGGEEGWNQVTASAGHNKKWSNVVNGSPNGAVKEKHIKESYKDNRVAYLLFYQRI